MKTDYDLIILGAGPAGLTAGIYASRSLLDTLIIENKVPGGQLINIQELANYPGYLEEDGYKLVQKIEQQARDFGAEIIIQQIEKIELNSDMQKVHIPDHVLHSKALIIATGSEPRKLNIPGEEEYTGKGVSYCATCDGAFYRGKEVTVIGGGDSALKESLHLADFASTVNIVHRRNELRAVKALQRKALNEDKINFVLNSTPEEIVGEESVEGIKIFDKNDNKEKIINTDGVFIYIGTEPNTELVRGQIELSESGQIITDRKMKSSVSGVYAAGDVREKYLRQVITAVSDGATAATSASEHIKSQKN